MKLKLVAETDGQSHELLVSQISIEDGPDFFKHTELQAWSFIMTSGRAIIRFIWESWAKERMAGLRRNGYRPVEVLTVFGKVNLNIPRPRKGNLPPVPRVSFMMDFLYTYLAAFFPYRQVRGLIRVLLGHKITRWKAWSGTQKAINKLKEKGISSDSFAHPAEALIIQADGTGVKIRVKETERLETRTGLKGETKQKPKRYRVVTRELKLGVVSTGTAKAGRGRQGLADRFIYGSLDEANEFSESFAMEVYRIYGPQMGKTRGVVIGDGAAWIENMRNTYFPFARHQLDLWHIAKRLAELFHGWDEPVSEAMKLLQEGRKDELFRYLRNRYESIPNLSRKEKEDFYGYMVYLRKNWSHLVGFIHEEGPLRKSSSQGVEKHMDVFVKRRFKGQGMHWSPEGLNKLIYMRCLVINKGLAPWMNPSQEELYSIGVRG